MSESTGLAWITERRYFEMGYWIFFVRDIDESTLASRLNATSAPTEYMTWTEAVEYELSLQEDFEDVQVLRLGSFGDWAFALGEYGTLVGEADTTISSISDGTEAVSLSRTLNSEMWFSYARNGELKIAFDPEYPLILGGSDSSVLVDQMREFGILGPDGPPSPKRTPAELEHAMLMLMETSFGIGLPLRRIKDDALLTVKIFDE